MDQSALPTVLQTVKTRLVVKMAAADFVVLVIVDLVVPITSAFWGSRMDLAPPRSGDTTQALHFETPSCNTLTASPELIFTFMVPEGKTYGYDMQLSGYDTVIQLMKVCTMLDHVLLLRPDRCSPILN
jgi:hypothetical protein